MQYQTIDAALVSAVGPYNGTWPVGSYRIDEATTLISVENIALMSGGWSLRGAPSPGPADVGHVHPDVAASLEHSLKEHADVWAELSKY